MRFQSWLNDTIKVPKHVRTPFLLSWLCSFVSTLLLLSVYFILQPQVPLFYSLSLPHEYLAAKEWLFLIPAISYGINFTHTIWIHLLEQYAKVLNEIFVWSSLAVQVLLLSALVRIIWLVL